MCVGVKIITQQMQPSKILPKPSSAAMPSSSSGPIMVVSSNGAIMTTKLVSTPTGTSGLNTRPKYCLCSSPGLTHQNQNNCETYPELNSVVLRLVCVCAHVCVANAEVKDK